MNIPDIFAIAGSALNAQNNRMSVIASNLANVDSITPAGGTPYRSQDVVFSATPVSGDETASDVTTSSPGVDVVETVSSNAPPKKQYNPGSPFADASGYVLGSNVSQISQMVDLIDSSNSYSASIAVLQQASRVDQQMLSSFQVS